MASPTCINSEGSSRSFRVNMTGGFAALRATVEDNSDSPLRRQSEAEQTVRPHPLPASPSLPPPERTTGEDSSKRLR